LVAVEVNATKPPSAEIAGSAEEPLAGSLWAPVADVRLTCASSLKTG
jgi:hypothetical protein